MRGHDAAPASREKRDDAGFVALGAAPATDTPEQFAREIAALVAYWAPVAESAGIHP